MDKDASSLNGSPKNVKKHITFFDRYFAFMDAKLPSDALLLYVLTAFFIAVTIFVAFDFNKKSIITVPKVGGVLSEGVIGTPHFVNPVLASTRADHDLVTLIYSGILRLSEEGNLVNDLAESVTISDDGLVYNILLRDDARFHDNEPVRAEDVAYTISLIQDPNLKSPLRGNWTGVVVEIVGERELNIVLDSPYTPFVENLTLGILPEHIWNSLTVNELPQSQHNIEPIGSGPYRVESISRTKAGLINEYTLTAFSGHTIPNIETVILSFYQSEDDVMTALTEGKINSTASLSYKTLSDIDQEKFNIVEQPLPRVFSIFFNQNKSPVLLDDAVREALNISINREELVETVLAGYGKPTASPIPFGFIDVESASSEEVLPTNESTSSVDRIARARELLEDAGWERGEDSKWRKEIDDTITVLHINIATENTELFEETAAYIKTAWESLGVEVDVGFFESSNLVQDVIRRRDYQALLFGNDVGRALDFYPFWHSSQREDPGLNVALYTNITTDDALETARITQDPEERKKSLQTFEAEVTREIPAIFLYSPSFTYVIDSKITMVPQERIARPNERLSNIGLWHISEQHVWPIFTD